MNEWIDAGLIKVINRFSHPFYLIKLNKTKHCTCVAQPSRDPDPGCSICLGTGYAIRIYDTHGTAQNASTVFRSQQFNVKNESVLMPRYWVVTSLTVNFDDHIVDGEKVFVIKKADDMGVEDKTTYWLCECSPKKSHQTDFLANFQKIIGG